jgi:hypothetical protein
MLTYADVCCACSSHQENQKTIIANKRKLARLHDTLWCV